MREGSSSVLSETPQQASPPSFCETSACCSPSLSRNPSFCVTDNDPTEKKPGDKEGNDRLPHEYRREREDEIRVIAKRQGYSLETNRRFQQVYIEEFTRKQIRREKEWIEEMKKKGRDKTYHPFVKDERGMPRLGCSHYVRNCKLKADCCGVFVTCRLCHDEEDRCQHDFVRTNTEFVLCMLCNVEQVVGSHCKNCQVPFANYYCPECKFYDSTPGKDIYHCPKCAMCRLGKGLGIDNVHCDECNGCISKDHYGQHKCLPKSLLGQCPICSGDLFTTMKDTYTLRCGHWIHSECCDSYRQTYRNYTCPICHKSMYDLSEKFLVEYFAEVDAWLADHQMPPEYKDRLSHIYCYDCEKKSIVPYHFVFHKCANPGCGSYNTHAERMFNKDDPHPPESSYVDLSITSTSERSGDEQIDTNERYARETPQNRWPPPNGPLPSPSTHCSSS